MSRIRLLPLLLAVALLAAACGGPAAEDESDALLPGVSPAPTTAAAPTSPGGAQTTITFGAQDYKRATYEPLIKQFNAENPDVQVVFVSLDEVLREGDTYTFETSKIVRAADTAETFSISPSDVEDGLVRDLKPFLDADGAFSSDDFFPAAIQSIEGGIYIIPTALQVPLLQYNRALWDTAGLPAPTADWTFADFSAATDALAKKSGDTVNTYGYVSWSSEMTMLLGKLASVGINMLDSANQSMALDDPKVIAALERTATQSKSGAFFAPNPGDGSAWDTIRALITEGKVGMWDGFMGFSGQNQPLDYETGYAAMPEGIAGFSGGNSEGMIMSAGTQSPEAAWRWLSFLSQQEIKEPFSFDRGPMYVPARKSTAESSGYWKKLDEPTTTVVRAMLDRTPTATNTGEFYSLVYGPLSEAFAAISKGTDPATAARDAQTARAERLAQVEPTAEVAQTSAPFVVATPQIQVAAEGATKIMFSVPYDAGALAKSAKAFNDTNAGVFVEIKVTTPATSTLELADLARDADCFSWFSLPEEKDRSLVLDLQPLIDADPTFARDDYPEALLSLYRDGGKQVGLPSTVLFPIIVYNKTLFEDAGIALPTENWTLEAMIDAAKQLTSGEGEAKRYGYASLTGMSQDMQLFLSLSGAKITTGSGKATEPNFTDPQVTAAIRSFIDLVKTASPHTELDGYKQNATIGGSSAWDMAQAGEIGMWTQYGLFNFSSPDQSETGTIAFAPLPIGQNEYPSEQLYASGLLVSATSSHAQSCWQWFKYLSEDTSDAQNSFPARLSVAQADVFLEGKPEGTDVVVRSITTALRESKAVSTPFWQSPLDLFWFYQAADRALQDGDLDKELEAAQQITSEFMACVRGGEVGPACAKQVDPDYAGWQSAEPE